AAAPASGSGGAADSVRSIRASSASAAGVDRAGCEAEELEKEKVLTTAQFGTLCESVLENILLNIVSEANQREFDITARPRLIALPPRRKPQPQSQRTPQSSQR
uniref:Histone H3 n=2 Tax=Macrostomum lignano TaxID=282301 RepID=A0A1I8FUQ3_9PLAT